MKVFSDLEQNIDWFNSTIHLQESYDLMTRYLNLGGVRSFFIGLNGMCDGEQLQKIIADLQPAENELGVIFDSNIESRIPDNVNINKESSSSENILENVIMQQRFQQLQKYVEARIGYTQVEISDHLEYAVEQILVGQAAFIIDKYAWILLIDVRTYPDRGAEEPDTEQVMGGAQDGFVENIVTNSNLIRRRIRTPELIMESMAIGASSKTDLVIAYLGDKADISLIDELKQKIKTLRISSLTMGAKSLEELLLHKSWLHPLPVVQTTSRPDTACSYLMEGHVLVLVDNSPMVLIFPCSIFQFTQSAEDYYKSPIVGSYFRVVRFFCLLISMFLMPVFLLITNTFPEFAEKIKLVQSTDITKLEIFIYVLAMELGLDLFRYSSMHAASKYSGPLSIIGGLIAGDIAISLNWASEETVFYAAITLLATIALASIEFSEGVRIYRIFLILTTGIAGLWGYGLAGFCVGTGMILLSIITTPTFGNYSYLWPLFPFEWGALKTLLFRYPTYKAQPSKVWRRK